MRLSSANQIIRICSPILSDFRGAHAPSRAVSGALAGNISQPPLTGLVTACACSQGLGNLLSQKFLRYFDSKIMGGAAAPPQSLAKRALLVAAAQCNEDLRSRHY